MTEEQNNGRQLYLPFEEFMSVKSEDNKALPHFENPKNDNERLLEFQYQYRHGNLQALSDMFSLAYEICYKMINKETNRNKHIKDLSDRQREEKSMDAASYIIERYLRTSEWFISKSFIGYLYLRVQHELYYQRKVDEIVDFVDLDEFFKEGEEPEAPEENRNESEEMEEMKYEFEWNIPEEKMPPLQEKSRGWSVDCYITAVDMDTGMKIVLHNCYYDYKEKMWFDEYGTPLERWFILAWADHLPPYGG